MEEKAQARVKDKYRAARKKINGTAVIKILRSRLGKSKGKRRRGIFSFFPRADENNVKTNNGGADFFFPFFLLAEREG